MGDILSISVQDVAKAQQLAQMRLQLYVTGEVNRIFGTVAAQARRAIAATLKNDATVDAFAAFKLSPVIELIWKDGFDEYHQRFTAWGLVSAMIPFGSLAVMHLDVFKGFEDSAKIAKRILREQHGNPPATGIGIASPLVFRNQTTAILAASYQRNPGDYIKFSERLWKLNLGGLSQIQAAIYHAVANGSSAWQLADAIERRLGAGHNCPRWTRQRLYGLTKKQIAAGDKTGLLTGEDCNGKGVSYKALRLARTELQAVHALADDMIMEMTPWVEFEQINLSGAHPDIGCECEDIVAENDGVYPKGTIELPVHPNCLCYKSAILPDPSTFVGQLRGWLAGTGDWPAMDKYATWLAGSSHGALFASGLAALNTQVTSTFPPAANTFIDGDPNDLDSYVSWLMGEPAGPLFDRRKETAPAAPFFRPIAVVEVGSA